MKKISRRQFLAVSGVAAAAAALAACGGGSSSSAPASTDANAGGASSDAGGASSASSPAQSGPLDIGYDVQQHDAISAEVYNNALGEFYSVYSDARSNVTDIAERYAMMAVAEAKLMESGTMLPTTTQGGAYTLSRVCPHTVTGVLFGADFDRYHQVLVATEFIKKADREALRAKWDEVRGTGTYEKEARAMLASMGYTISDEYSLGYSSDPAIWDTLATSRAADAEAIVNTFDGLMEYDIENIQQPALAESYEESEDGLTYTFHIRKGLKWVDSQGRPVADVKADDFVAGMQHMMDAMGGLEYLIEGIIVNATEYINHEITDFSQVGVAAPNDTTLVYTLEAPCPYFMTMLGYSVFAPMSRQYYTSQGGKFGAEFDASAEDYNYGKTPDNIAYCGPYLVTNATAKNTIVFKANPSYWNAKNINIQTLTWLFNDGSDPTKAYEDAKAGTIAGVGLTTNTLVNAKNDGLFDEYAYVSDTNATSYMAFMNMNRAAFANVADPTTVISTHTAETAARTRAAMNNQNFRLAVCCALDRGTWNEQQRGADLKFNNLRNSYTPYNFVTLPEEVTIDLGTFPAGTFYGEIMQAQIDADGYEITVYDPAQPNGGDSFDGWYSPAYAAELLDAATAELASEGVDISASNPIYLDLPYPQNDDVFTKKAMVFKQTVEASLGGRVIINTVACVDYNEWYYTGYYTDYGYEANYDIYDLSGWGPDYGDPQTYLDTMLPDYAGYMTKCLGIF